MKTTPFNPVEMLKSDDEIAEYILQSLGNEDTYGNAVEFTVKHKGEDSAIEILKLVLGKIAKGPGGHLEKSSST